MNPVNQKTMFKRIYWNTKLHMVVLALLVIGGLNWGTTAFGYNLVEMLSDFINRMINRNYAIDKVIYVLVALAALKIAMHRTNWLPFLGKTVMPQSLVPLSQPKNSNHIIRVRTRPNVKVAYWSALPNATPNKVPDVLTAYGDYSNSGVVMSDAKGIAEFSIMEGSGYETPSGRRLRRHVHYRVVGLTNGMMGSIKTVNY